MNDAENARTMVKAKAVVASEMERQAKYTLDLQEGMKLVFTGCTQ